MKRLMILTFLVGLILTGCSKKEDKPPVAVNIVPKPAHLKVTGGSLTLGKSVTLVDKSSLAGLLDPSQRDGLLSTAWLLVSDTTKANPSTTVTLQIGPVEPGAAGLPNHKLLIPIMITTTGVPRNRVDPTIWDAIGRVGRYSDSTQQSSLRVDIECVVDNPADQ